MRLILQLIIKKGYRGILFDIDNTLVPHNAPANEQAVQLMKQLKAIGFQICLVSNNKEPRVAAFNEKLQVNYIYKAGKPKRAGYQKAMRLLGTNTSNTLFVGDQLFTDLWGANNSGITSILVKPIDKKKKNPDCSETDSGKADFAFLSEKPHDCTINIKKAILIHATLRICRCEPTHINDGFFHFVCSYFNPLV